MARKKVKIPTREEVEADERERKRCETEIRGAVRALTSSLLRIAAGAGFTMDHLLFDELARLVLALRASGERSDVFPLMVIREALSVRDWRGEDPKLAEYFARPDPFSDRPAVRAFWRKQEIVNWGLRIVASELEGNPSAAQLSDNRFFDALDIWMKHELEEREKPREGQQ